MWLSASAKYVHAGKHYNDVMPGIEAGWAYFLNGSVTIEPSVYYDQSFKCHKDFSTFGVRLGIGIYLFNKYWRERTHRNCLKRQCASFRSCPA